MDKDELEIIRDLDGVLRTENARDYIEAAIGRVQQKLDAQPESSMAWEPLPIEIYGDELPSFILSSWVFILRAQVETGAERHPNSHQRMVSYKGTGDFQTRLDGPWESHVLKSELDAPLEERWISIPVNVWHQSAKPDNDWTVVSFHTVPAEDLIEERPSSEGEQKTKQTKYI